MFIPNLKTKLRKNAPIKSIKKLFKKTRKKGFFKITEINVMCMLCYIFTIQIASYTAHSIQNRSDILRMRVPMLRQLAMTMMTGAALKFSEAMVRRGSLKLAMRMEQMTRMMALNTMMRARLASGTKPKI